MKQPMDETHRKLIVGWTLKLETERVPLYMAYASTSQTSQHIFGIQKLPTHRIKLLRLTWTDPLSLNSTTTFQFNYPQPPSPAVTFFSVHPPSQCFVVVVPSLLAARRARPPPRFAMPMPFLLSYFMLAFATAECG